MAEFEANTLMSAATGVSPFFPIYGFGPQFTIHQTGRAGKPPVVDAKAFGTRMAKLNDFLRV